MELLLMYGHPQKRTRNLQKQPDIFYYGWEAHELPHYAAHETRRPRLVASPRISWKLLECPL